MATPPPGAGDIRDLIAHIAGSRPRNRQKQIGPSELGGPCQRRIGYRLLDTPRNNPGGDQLASWIGTAVHTAIEHGLADNPDWDTEIGVALPAYNIRGTADAYHRPSKTLIDWKVVGETTLRKARQHGIGDQYRTQIHTYGLALDMAGTPVEHVAVAMIPRTGRSEHTAVFTEPLDHQIVEQALRRFEQIRAIITLAGAKAPLVLPTGDQFCRTCPWYLPAATDPGEACGGHTEPPPVTGNVTETQHNTKETNPT